MDPRRNFFKKKLAGAFKWVIWWFSDYETDGKPLELWEEHVDQGDQEPLPGNTIGMLFSRAWEIAQPLPEHSNVTF